MDWRQQIAPVGPSSRSAALAEVSNAIIDGVSYTPVRPYANTPIRRYADTLVPSLIGLLAMLALATLASGDPVPGDGKTSPVPVASPYAVVNHVGEADQQVTLKDGKLLAHRRNVDPFGIAIRGKFKGLPPVAEHPSLVSSPAQPNTSPVATNVLTLEQAVQRLPIGAVNIADREALIGSRPVHEGDLLVLELSGHQFVVWVQSIDQRGVQFCDINLQQHALKPFRFGPNELPDDLAGRRTDVRDFLKQDAN